MPLQLYGTAISNHFGGYSDVGLFAYIHWRGHRRMGIYNRYTAALLILAIISPQVFSAVRVPVIQNDEYIRQFLSRQTAITGAVVTPAGEVAFYGADKVYSFSAGDSVSPTIREVKPSTGVSYPYGPGAAYPSDPAYSPANATKAKVKPVLKVPKTKIVDGLKKLVKTNPAQVALGVATAAAVAGVGWIIEEGSQPIIKKAPPDGLTWDSYPVKGPYNYQSSHCNTVWSKGSGAAGLYEDATYLYLVMPANQTHYDAAIAKGYGLLANCTNLYVSRKIKPANYAPTVAEPVAITDSDLPTLDPWVNAQSAAWLAGLLKEICAASPNPSQCFTDMKSEGSLEGPATLQGPQTTKTSSFTRGDGTIGNRTETTKTKYDLTYGPDYFDVDTEKETTVVEDGEVVATTTEQDTSEPQDVSDSPEEAPEPEYTFQDSDMPSVDPFYEQKYPDGLQGVWNQAKTDLDSSNFLSFLNSFIPSFSGSCPAFGLSFAIGNMINLGSHEFASLCYVFDFIKIVLLVTAVLTARALTFGG